MLAKSARYGGGSIYLRGCNPPSPPGGASPPDPPVVGCVFGFRSLGLSCPLSSWPYAAPVPSGIGCPILGRVLGVVDTQAGSANSVFATRHGGKLGVWLIPGTTASSTSGPSRGNGVGLRIGSGRFRIRRRRSGRWRSCGNAMRPRMRGTGSGVTEVERQCSQDHRMCVRRGEMAECGPGALNSRGGGSATVHEKSDDRSRPAYGFPGATR